MTSTSEEHLTARCGIASFPRHCTKTKSPLSVAHWIVDHRLGRSRTATWAMGSSSSGVTFDNVWVGDKRPTRQWPRPPICLADVYSFCYPLKHSATKDNEDRRPYARGMWGYSTLAVVVVRMAFFFFLRHFRMASWPVRFDTSIFTCVAQLDENPDLGYF